MAASADPAVRVSRGVETSDLLGVASAAAWRKGAGATRPFLMREAAAAFPWAENTRRLSAVVAERGAPSPAEVEAWLLPMLRSQDANLTVEGVPAPPPRGAGVDAREAHLWSRANVTRSTVFALASKPRLLHPNDVTVRLLRRCPTFSDIYVSEPARNGRGRPKPVLHDRILLVERVTSADDDGVQRWRSLHVNCESCPALTRAMWAARPWSPKSEAPPAPLREDEADEER